MLAEPKIKVDKLDLALIKELRSDSRRSVRQLAKSLNESPSTIYNRVKRLESKEMIKKWTISLDYSLLNLNIIAWVQISLEKYQTGSNGNRFPHNSVVEQLKEIEGIYEIFFISGDYDILVKLRADSVKTIGSIVMEEIRVIPGVSGAVTNTCFEAVMEECDRTTL